MSFPDAEWVSRYCFTKLAAAWDWSLSHSSIPSSSALKMTRLGLLGWLTAHAALIALMIAESGTRFRSFGLVGDWPCLAVMMMAVLLALPRVRVPVTRLPTSGVEKVERGSEQGAGPLPAGFIPADQPVRGGQLLRGGHGLEVHPEDGRDAHEVPAAVVEAPDPVQDRLHLVVVVLHGRG